MAVREALVVATSSYEDTRLNQLRSPGLDAMELSEVLSDPAIGGYAVRPVIDQPAHVVRREIERFFIRRKPDDQLLLYLSCHGIKDSKLQLYFAAADTDRDLLESTAVPAGFVNGRLIGCNSRKILVLLDCCYSGAFKPGGAKAADTAVHLLEEFKDTGVAVITATDALQQAWEGDGPITETGEVQLSVFTAAAVEGLRSGRADRDGDGWISVDDLYGHVREEMLSRDARQNPLRWVLGGQGDLKIARRAAEGSAPLPLPRPLPALGSPAVEILAGISSVATSLKRTLGPVPRRVLLSDPNGTPYSSTDTREIVAALPAGHGHASLGVGLVRDLVADQYRCTQDGTVTAVVLFDALVRALQPALARGAHPTVLNHTVSAVLGRARETLLLAGVRPGDAGEEEVRRALAPEAPAQADPGLIENVVRAVLGAGPEGLLTIEPSAGFGITSRVSAACVLRDGHLSPYLATDERTGLVVLRDVAVLLSEVPISSADDGLAAVEMQDGRPLVLVAPSFGEEALAALAEHSLTGGPPCMAVPLPATDTGWRETQCKIVSLFTTASVFTATEEIRTLGTSFFGSARRVIASDRTVALVDGAGDPDRYAAHVRRFRDPLTRDWNPATLDRYVLAGTVSGLFVGGTNQGAAAERWALVHRAVRRGQAALSGGVLPGEAATLAALAHWTAPTGGTEEDGVGAALRTALTQPLWALAENHGDPDPGAVIARIRSEWPEVTYEALRTRVVPAKDAGVWVPASYTSMLLDSVESAVTAYLSLV
ncbi:TCP-1/cpn60 chaperonin family protein [Streptomyces sp. NPDC090045]|uniref:caspase, EACC1-associated type n=1 Tax=Streptomyces sp. NPDC090045 TaxID=3365927 RepID=UPI00381B9DF3